MQKAIKRPHRLAFLRKWWQLVIMMLAFISAEAQSDSAKYARINGYGFFYKRFGIDSVFLPPLYESPHVPFRAGALKYRKSDSSYYKYTGTQWLKLQEGGSATNGIDTVYTIGDTVQVIETPTETYFTIINSPFTAVLNDSTIVIGNDTLLIRGTGGSGGSGSVTAITQGYGIVATPNPIISTGTIRADTTGANGLVTRSELIDSTNNITYTENPIHVKSGANDTLALKYGYGLTTTASDTTLIVDSVSISTRAWRQKGIDSLASVLRAVIVDSAGDIRDDFPTGGSGGTTLDSAAFYLSINNAGDTIVALGDSYTQHQGATSSAHGYINIVGYRSTNTITNVGVGARGIVVATINANLNLRGTRSRRNVTLLAGFNDLRRGGQNYRTMSKLRYGVQGIALSSFLLTGTGASDASITKSGTWTGQNLAATGSRAGNGDITGTPVYATNSGNTLTATISGDNVVIGTRVSDSVNRTYGSFSVTVDGTLFGTFACNAKTDGISDGSQDNRTMFTAIPFFGLGTGSHTVVITTTSADSVFIDYVGTLMKPNDCSPVYIGYVPKLPTASYAINTGSGDVNGSDEVFDSGDSAMKVAIMLLRNQGYPIAGVNVNTSYFHTDEELDTDDLHPSNLGHAHIADAFSKAMGLGIRNMVPVRQNIFTVPFMRDKEIKFGKIDAPTTSIDFIGMGRSAVDGPYLFFNQPAGTTNTKLWDMFVNGAGTEFSFRAVNDAVSSATDALKFTRSGTTLSMAAFTVSALNTSGTFAATGAITSGGNGTFEGTLISSGSAAGLNLDRRDNGAFAWSMYSQAGNLSWFDNADKMTLTTAGRLGLGTTSPDNLIHSEISDATTNTVVYPYRATHISSGTVANGSGVGFQFENENGSNTNRITGTIESIYSDVSNGSEDADYSFTTARAGVFNVEAFRMYSTGSARTFGNFFINTVANGSAGTDSILVINTTEVRKVAASTFATGNIYTGNGTLGGNRTVTMSGNTLNFTGGNVGIGQASPTALLHTGAGTTSVAPLKFTSGTNLTTAEAGAMEFDGSHFYLSPSTTRKKIPLFTSATAAAGSILQGNGTDFSLLALGTANQQLRVNAGGTALEYFTPSASSATLIYQFAATQQITVSNTATETTIYGTGQGSAGIDGTANITTGSQIILKGSGVIDTDASVAGEVIFAFHLGSSSVAANINSLATGLVDATYNYEFKAIPLGTGTGQDYIWFIDIYVDNNGTPLIWKATGRESAVLTTTGTVTANVTVDWNTADSDNTVVSNYNTVEVVKK